MKTNERKDLHNKNITELKKLLSEQRQELLTARLSHTRGKLKNPSQLANIRKSIAQIATILRGKELANE